jgi:transcriptional regulator with XRE-family HTH domain
VIDVEGGWADLGAFIKAQRDAAQMSVRRLAELAGVSNPYLSQIERGLRKPSADILQQLAKALRISAETLYMRAGILDPDANTDNAVIEAIAVDPRLTADQRKSLITIYESFRAQNAGTTAPATAAPPTDAAPAAAAAKAARPPGGESARAGKR